MGKQMQEADFTSASLMVSVVSHNDKIKLT